MKKTTLTIVLLCSLLFPVAAQYADLGTGSLKDKIWWFDWNGFTMTNGANKTFTTTDGLTVTVTFSNVSAYVPLPKVMNTWSGAILHLLYNFSNTAIQPAFYSYGNAINSFFTMSITATRNGVAVPFTLVAADAEASVPAETTTFQTNGSVWRCVDFYRNSAQTTNPMTGCSTQSITITDTYGQAAQTGQNPVVATESPATGPLVIQTTIDKHNIQGGMGVAYGIFSPVDRGDLPASYGAVQHKLTYNSINSCNYLPPLPALMQNQDLKIGNIAGDADGQQTTNDNATGVADEEGVAVFPVYDRSGNYTLQVAVSNTTGADAWLSGWFDVDQDGAFALNEIVTAKVAPNATSIPLTWSNIPGTLPAGPAFGFRFRLSSDRVASQNATGFAPDGEAEDYLVPVQMKSFSVNFTMPDTICINTPLQITNIAVGASSYYWNFCVACTNGGPVNCANVSLPNSSLATPPPVTYLSPGVYDINLIADDGLPTKTSVCKQVVVMPEHAKAPVLDTATCSDSIILTSRFEKLHNVWKDGSTADTLVIRQPGTYWVNTSYGCAARDSFICRFNPKPAFTLGNDTTLCSGEKLELDMSMPGATYQWQDGKTTAAYSITTAGKYKLLIQSAAGCIGVDSLQVAITALPVVKLMADTAICEKEQVTLKNIQLQYTDSLRWGPSAGLSAVTAAAPVAKPAATTRYKLTAYNERCATSDSIMITVKTAAVLQVTADTLTCKGVPLRLSVSAAGATQYSWYPANGLSDVAVYNPIALPAVTTRYYVKGTGPNICPAEDSVLITVQPPAVFGLSPLTAAVCESDTIALTASGADTYRWLMTGNPQNSTAAGVLVQPVVTTAYAVEVYDRICNIKDTLTALITVDAKPVLTITKSNDIDCVTGEARLTASGGGSYEWYPANTLTGAHSYNPIARTDRDTWYHVKATGLNGCVSEDSIRVQVFKNGNVNSYPVVTAFTPNSDGRNDCFRVKNWGYIKSMELAVYNRWGQQMFITTNPGDCWDGRFRGVEQPPGTFVYTIKAETLCGTVVKKGTLVLIR